MRAKHSGNDQQHGFIRAQQTLGFFDAEGRGAYQTEIVGIIVA